MEFTIFRIFVESLQGVKYMYPSYFRAAYGRLQNVTINGEKIEYTPETLELFKKAVKFVFIPDEYYDYWSNKSWFENLPVRPQDWTEPTTNNILHSCILDRILEQ